MDSRNFVEIDAISEEFWVLGNGHYGLEELPCFCV